MTIKPDEIEVVKLILKHCTNRYDMLPTDELLNMNINGKRLTYLIETKFTWFIEYGVNAFFGWLDIPAWEIKQIYKNKHGVDLNDN